MLLATAILGALEILTALAQSFALVFLLLLGVGAAALTMSTTSTTMAQTGAEPQLRGRVMAVYFVATSAGKPIGGPLLGWLANWLGPRWPMAFGGIASIVVAVAGTGYLLWRGSGAPREQRRRGGSLVSR